MSSDLAVQIGRDALFMVMLISAPMLGLGLLVGILVSVFQATTQIQEQTLAFIPKIIAVFVAILIFGPWIISIMIDYTRELFMLVHR
jgi:flagellar biosynthesis protein FliQ